MTPKIGPNDHLVLTIPASMSDPAAMRDAARLLLEVADQPGATVRIKLKDPVR